MAEEFVLVELGLDTSKVALPRTIKIPSTLVASTGWRREFTIYTPDEKVPEPVKTWMQSDDRYSGWFAPQMPPESTKGKQKKAEAPEDGTPNG